MFQMAMVPEDKCSIRRSWYEFSLPWKSEVLHLSNWCSTSSHCSFPVSLCTVNHF